MKLFIKNMVCMRCIRTVQRILTEAGLHVMNVQLGEAEVEGVITAAVKKQIATQLAHEGFELLDDRNSRLVEQIKTLVISEIHHEAGKKKESVNFSSFIASQTGHEYSYLSKLFSSVEGITIEKFIIAQKIEKVKELLVYDELNLNEISWRLGYSSPHHLSNQFKQITGMTPTEFRKNHPHDRKHLDHI